MFGFVSAMRFWDVLVAPDDFARDPYGELTNQLGHTMLGLLSSLLIICAYREIAGEMPYRVVVFGTVSGVYAVLIEAKIQGWKPGDSWFDWLMVSLGSAGVLFPLKEAGIHGNLTLLTFNHSILAWIFCVWAVALGFRVGKRVKQWI